MLRKVSTAAGTNRCGCVLVSLAAIQAAALLDSRVQDPPHSSVHHGLAVCSTLHHAVCGMHSTVNHKMHTPCCHRSLDVATPRLSKVLRTCSQTAFMVAWNVCNRRQVKNDQKVHSISAQHVRPHAVAVVAVV